MSAQRGSTDIWRARGRAAASIIVWLVVAFFMWRILRMTEVRIRTGAVSDFYYFWDAGKHVLGGDAARVYTTHPSPVGDLYPLGYPPPFLLLAWPLALLPVGASVLLWLMLTGVAYVLTARQPLRIALVNPTVPYNVKWQQTGFLTSSILLGGAYALAKRPLVAGAVLGFMIIKPHLALLVPIALIAGRQWKALAAAATCACLQVALAAILFGPSIYVGWWHSLLQFNHWVETGFWQWTDLSSLYAFLRSWGVGGRVAYACQIVSAIAAALVVARSWWDDWDSKIPVLAAATMLVAPYLCSHDAVMMIAPLGWFASRSWWRAALIWALLLVAWFNVAMFNHALLPFHIPEIPDTTPVAAALSLLFLWRERGRD